MKEKSRYHNKARGRITKNWAPIKTSPRVQEGVAIIKEVLSDGQEHSAKDLVSAFEKAGSYQRYLYDALKLLPEVKQNNRGRGGCTYTWKSPEPSQQAKRDANPVVARSTDIAKAKNDKESPKHAALRDRVEEVLPGYDPVVSIAQIANDDSVPIAVRLECHRDVAKYTTPMVKAAEITTDDQPIALNFRWES